MGLRRPRTPELIASDLVSATIRSPVAERLERWIPPDVPPRGAGSSRRPSWPGCPPPMSGGVLSEDAGPVG